MADPLATVLTHITNLVSFRSSLRLLVIAGSIILCWIYIEPHLNPLKIPKELSITLITIIGFSIGALISAFCFGITDFSIKHLNKIIHNREKTKETLKKNEEIEADNNKKRRLLESSFSEYSYNATNILLQLNNKDTAIRLEDSTLSEHNKSFAGLIDGEIIHVLHKIDKSTFFCTINPIYKETIKNLFIIKHKNEVDNLVDEDNTAIKKLIDIFKNDSEKEEYVFNIDNDIMEDRYNFKPVIQHEFYVKGDFFENCNIQFYITEHHYPHLVEKLGGKVRNYILGHYISRRPSVN